MIIGISGYSGSGKDAVGAIIQYLNCFNVSDMTLEEILAGYQHHEWWLEDQSGWEVKKFAAKLKTIASLLTGIPYEKFEDQEFKKTNLGPEWSKWEIYDSDAPWIAEGEKMEVPMTVRDFLQKLGTEGLRTGLHENTWVNALMADYKLTPSSMRFENGTIEEVDEKYPNWIVTDTRFPNEAQAIKDKGGILIRVSRPGVSAINAHASETSLDNWDFDERINNDGDLVGLMAKVYRILNKHKLLKHEDHKTKDQDAGNQG